MGGKSEARAQRKALALAKFEADKSTLISRVGAQQGPFLEQLPEQVRCTPRLGVSIAELEIPKQPKVGENKGRFGYQMTWCVRKQDVEGAWSWGEPRAWDEAEYANEISVTLNALAGAGWNEIDKHSSDSGHKLHHEHEISDIASEAIQRWRHLGLEQYDTLFRFRMGNKKRAWGVVVRGHFFMVWWERHHRIYAV